MTLGEIRAQVKLYLNVNNSQLNDDLSDANYNTFIQNAYKNIWIRLRGTASKSVLLASQDLPWASGAQTVILPTNLQNALIYDLWYLDSGSNPYARLNAFFETRNVLRITLSGITISGFNFRVYFIPEAETLTSDSSTPALIPPSHHEVIVWETLKIIKMLYDKEIPDSWMRRMDDIEFTLNKELMTRPVSQRANIVSLDQPIARPLASLQ